ncbi:MAG: hypothetical protein JW957_07410, partial [Candidatus Omnitrophica bacterium]|nr:hypothetical protein [Candidatus Omnitrophota bacterium]
MRKLLTTLFFFAFNAAGLLANGFSGGPYANDSHTRLLLHLDETGGYKAVDASSYENNGSVGGGTWKSDGKFGGCIYLDGSWDVIRCGTEGSLSPTDQITFEAWVKPEDVSGIRQVISKDIIGPPWYQYHLEIRDGKVTAGVTLEPAKHISVTSSGNIEAGRWAHLAGAYDGETLRLYIDGKKEPAEAKGKGVLINSGKQLNIGSWSNDYWYKGCIDEVRISAVDRFNLKPEVSSSTDDKNAEDKFPVNKTAKAPRIDGVVSPDEWKGAKKITGFRSNIDGKVTPRPQPEIYLAFDDEFLYMGFTCPFEGELKKDIQGRDSPVWRDDSLELFLDPFRKGENIYQLILNSNGALYDSKNGSAAWDSKAVYQTTVEGKAWSGEMAIPFSSFGEKTPYDEASWGINLARNYAVEGDFEFTSIAGVIGGYNQPKLFSPVSFRGGPTSIALSSSSLRLQYSVKGTSKKMLEAEMDVSAIPPAQRRTIKGEVALTSAEGRETVKTVIDRFIASKDIARLNVTDIPAGKYQLTASIYDNEGRLIGEQENIFIKPDIYPWLNNKIGTEPVVPPPWTPVQVKKNAINCWNRSYKFDGHPFPAQIETGKSSILSSPIRIKGRVNGKEIAWEAGKLQFAEQNRELARFNVQNTADNLILKGVTTVEFDGMLRANLQINTANNASLEELYMEIPLDSRYATLQQILHNAGDFYDPNILGDIPESSEGPFSPYIWLGNEDVGLAWFAESARGWNIQKKEKVFSIIKTQGKVVLRINLVDNPVTLKEPLSLTFGLQATPVKPVPADWQTVYMSCFEEDKPNIYLEWAHPWTMKWFAFPEPAEPVEKYFQRMEASKNRGEKYIQYINVTCASAGIPEYRYYEEEWNAGGAPGDTGDVKIMGHPLMRVCTTTTWSDFFLYSLKKFVDAYPVDGLYTDNAIVLLCTNANHGCGYGNPENAVGTSIFAAKDQEKRIYKEVDGTYPIFATRELQKRIYKYVKAKNPNFILVSHSAGSVMLPFISFYDSYAEGERFMGSYLKKHGGDYIDAVPLDKFRAEFTGANWGIIPMVLCQLRGEYLADPKYAETFVALARIHGT